MNEWRNRCKDKGETDAGLEGFRGLLSTILIKFVFTFYIFGAS